MQPPSLAQRGRATFDFHCAVRGAVSELHRRSEGELAQAGITAETMPDDLEARHRLVDETLATSSNFRLRNLLNDWTARDHGPIAEDAFDEIRQTVGPKLAALDNGPSTLERNPDIELPNYFSRVWFHRTTGGWDASPDNGFVHGELIHKLILTRMYGGDIFQQRRQVAELAPRRDYRHVLDMGASSGHFTVALADVFPDAEISGVDFSAPMLEHAMRVGNERGAAWKLYQRAAEATGFPDGSFDLVGSYNLIHEIPPGIIRAIFAESFRLLEPGGHMIMADVPRYFDLDKMSVWRFDLAARYGGEPYWRSASSTDLKAVAEAVGFTNVSGFTLPKGQPYVVIAEKPARAS